MQGNDKAPVSLLVLYAVNSFLFLVLSFFFLPDGIVKVLGSAAGVALGVLGLKSLNPRETEGASTRYRGLFVITLSVAALLQGALLLIGFFNPCRISTIPGSTVLVDGKFLARTPDPIPSGDTNNVVPWLTPHENQYFLRWDTHEIKVSKKWYVTNDRSQEFVQNVSVPGLQLWNPAKAFRHWRTTAELKPLFKITSSPGNDKLAQAVNSAVQGWDFAWTKALFGGPADPDRTDPYEAVLQVVNGHVELQIRDWTSQALKPLRPIHPIVHGEMGNNNDKLLSSIRDDAFEQLLTELAIPNVKVPEQTDELVALTETLKEQVSTAAVSAETPLPSPARTPAIFPSPEAGFTTAPTGTPTPPATSSPASANVVRQLATIATEAAKNNRLDVAITAQTALRQVGERQLRDRGLARDLQQANAAVGEAIKSKGAKGRIYIHIADESQRAPARKLQDLLVKNNEFAVIGIQNVGGRAYIPDTAEVRYFAFPNPPATKQAAEEIVTILEHGGVRKPRPSYVIPSERDKRVSSDINTHFEIWFARDSFGGNR